MTTWNPAEYDKAWVAMANAGKDPHGEVAFVERLIRRHGLDSKLSILDAGCGTGRVACEFDRRGYIVEGTDIDSDMLEQARGKAAHLRWTQTNLAHFSSSTLFDLMVLAGNVILFVDAVDQPFIAQSLRAHIVESGLVVAGMQLTRADGRHVAVSQWDEWMTSAGFELIERFSDWDDGEWNSTADYVVSVHRATSTR